MPPRSLVLLWLQDEIDINEFLESFRLTAQFSKQGKKKQRWSRVRKKLDALNKMSGTKAPADEPLPPPADMSPRPFIPEKK